MVADNLPDSFLHEGAATQSDSGRLVFERLEKLTQGLGFELAKTRLTLLSKERGNCPTSARFDQRIEIIERPVQQAGEFPAHCGLAGSHESDEYN